MLRALSEYQIYGIKTTIPFFKRILGHPQFLKGDYTTHFISDLEEKKDGDDSGDKIVALLAAGIKSYCESKTGLGFQQKKKTSLWKAQGRWKCQDKRFR
jgi:pyruvate carboxylase